MRQFWIVVFALGLVGFVSSHATAGTERPDPTLVNPIGLGANYTGTVRAGLGITHTETAYGLRLGEFVLQPRFLFENELSSNFFKVDTRNENTEETIAFTFHLRPGVGIHNPDSKQLKMNFGVDVDVLLPASANDQVTDQTNVGLNLNGGLTYTLTGLMSLTLQDSLRRELLVRPASAVGGSSNRNHNALGADITFHPGGGALEFELGYTWNAILYDSLTDLNHHDHKLNFMGSWRFLPLSYVFLESTFSVYEYATPQSDEEVVAAGNRVDGLPFKVYAGFSGYLTNRIALTVRAGYGNSLLGAGENFSSFIGDARFSFRFTPRTALHVGGGRDFSLAGLGGYLDITRAFVSFEQSIADIVLLHVDLGFDYRIYGPWVPADLEFTLDDGTTVTTTTTTTAARRQDYGLHAGVLADFEISRIFGLSVGYRFAAELTDFAVTSRSQSSNATFSTPATSFQGYMDHRVFLTLNLRY